MRAGLLVVLLLLSLSPLSAQTITVPTPSLSASFSPTDSGERITAPGYSTAGSPGDPDLPFVDVRVILPPGANPTGVALSGASVGSAGAHEIAPAPPAATSADDALEWGMGKQIHGGRNVLSYSANQFYPAEHVTLVGDGSMRKWRMVTVRYHPYRWNPATKELELASGGSIAVSYSSKSVTTATIGGSGDSVLSDEVSQIAANFDSARPWYEGGTRVLATSTPVGYTIITTAAIVAGSSRLQAFVTHKTNRGFTVNVATEAQWGGGTGDTGSNRIRAYLKSTYINKATKYVLLIGNPDPGLGDVPMKMLWPRRSAGTYPEAPSDYYYADLTGNWDPNGNGYYGEQDGDFSQGGIDIYPEVIVGRIPFYGSFTDLDSILQKIIDYEAGGIGGSWVRKVLLSMKPSDSVTPGYQLGEAIKTDAAVPAGFSYSRVYEDTYGLNPPPTYIPCTYDTVLAAWQQHAGFHFWWTHGNQTLASEIMTSDRCQYLDDHYPSFTFQVSCLNAYPENSMNLGYALLKRGAIATDSATRVSWYYPGQVDYTNTDSNTGMAYRYALKLVRDHMPCGDAHSAMMTAVPNILWANHCVFNLYGDPSLAYAAGPVITHTPLTDTDNTTAPYTVQADIATNGALAAGSPVIKWNTNGGSTFTSVQMTLVSGATYSGQIPAKPLGTTVYYYIYAADVQGRTGSSPSDAPTSLYSFRVKTDTQAPTVQHTPLTNTGDTTGPYDVKATVTDDCGVSSVVVRYNVNGAADTELPMLARGANVYEANIPGSTKQGDRIDYYILATDTSTAHKTTRVPASGYYSFKINRVTVAVYNSVAVPSYFVGTNSNIYSSVVDALNTDPQLRFSPTTVASLTSADLNGQDALVLPDNGVAASDLASVSNWFAPGKVLVVIDSSASYAAYSGFLWPNAAGTSGYNVCWDQYASVDDQKIVLQDPITLGYQVGQIIKSRGYGAQLYTSQLPADAVVLSVSNTASTRAYAAYRDVPGHGRLVALGPFRPLETAQYSMLREALAARTATPRVIGVSFPAGGESFDTGQVVNVRYSTSGDWSSSDHVKLEYTTGGGAWHTISGADSLAYNAGSFSWSTTGLPASTGYSVRATLVGGSVTGQTAGPFAIAPGVGISQAKQLTDGQVVKLPGKVVTMTSAGSSYIEEPSRTAGIRVSWSAGLPISTLATVTGTLSTVNGERVLSAAIVEDPGVFATVAPLAMPTKALGGGAFGYQQAVADYSTTSGGSGQPNQPTFAVGTSTIGLLVKLVGKVTAVGTDHFYLDDGAGCSDGSGAVGVKVTCGSLSKPTVGAHVTVIGISGTYLNGSNLFRTLILFDSANLRVVP